MTNLDKLIEAVEAGEWTAAGDGDDTWLKIHDAGLRTSQGYIYEAWRLGSLDAAKALHEALFPNHGWMISCQQWVEVWGFGPAGTGDTVRGTSVDPARAWLLAILKAYRAKGQDQ